MTATHSCHSSSATHMLQTSSICMILNPHPWTTGFLNTVFLRSNTSAVWWRVKCNKARSTPASRKTTAHLTDTTQQSTTNSSTTNILNQRALHHQKWFTQIPKRDWMPWAQTPLLITTERIAVNESNTRIVREQSGTQAKRTHTYR